MLRANTFTLVFFLALTVVADASAQNWARFHGPNGSGLATNANLPAELSEENVLWKMPLTGHGSSSPVVWGDAVFITSCNRQSGELTLQSFDAKNGTENWSVEFQSQPYNVHRLNSFASATPAVDEKHVYVSFASAESTMLVALDHDGKPVWKRDFGTWVSQHGFSVSPIVYKDIVIFFNSQQAERIKPGNTPGTSRVIAVNRNDGTDVWTAPLTATRTCYAVPSVFTDSNGVDQIISCNTGDGFFSLDPDTGKQNWATLPFKMRTVASTLIADGVVIGSNGSGGGGNYLVAIKPDSQSPTEKPKQAYQLQKANYVPSPVAVSGLLFFFTDKGVGNCVDLQTGAVHWQERVSSAFSGSAVATQDNIYIVDDSGTMFVIAAAKDYQLKSKMSLGEPSQATPAIGNGRMFVRTESQLICVGTDK